MDLTYMTDKKVDIGVIENYQFDLAFGSDENDFTCEIRLQDHCCEAGYMLYIDGTEYGGIIDNISPDTKSKKVVYGGRTWHGVLENKILCPDNGEDYLYLSGEANEVLATIISLVGLSDLFSASTDDSGIDIVDYKVRYDNAYTVISKMLHIAGGKLKTIFSKGYVVLSAVPYIDYSRDEEWDSSQLAFKIKKNYRAVNHLICLGKGDLKNRAIIHLFTDENGGLQPYSTIDNPVKNSDYILDTSNKVMFEEDEICDKYDLGNAQDTINYVRLETEPPDWHHTYMNYFKQNANNGYDALASWIADVYTLQLIQPSDWSVNYKDYFKKQSSNYVSVESISQTAYAVQTVQPSDWNEHCENYFKLVSGNYTAVTRNTADIYTKQTAKPADWKNNYGNYYYYWSDGTTYDYRKVQGVTKYKYVPQTLHPSDWDTNYKNYFSKNKDDSGYTVLQGNKAPKWVSKRYCTKESYQVAPKWQTNFYYTNTKPVTAPTWATATYYTKSINTVPSWAANTYYTKSTQTFIPQFVSNAYFEKFIDNYAVLVDGGIEKLKKSYNCDKIAITLDPTQTYDINDLVGANETVTGIMVWQPITKKIVNIDKNHQNIEYQIGDDK
jgi:hypothetical protein